MNLLKSFPRKYIPQIKIFKSKVLISTIILYLFIFPFNSQPAFSAQLNQDKLTSFQNKVSNKFTNQFCNSIAFGLGKESALKFSSEENKREFSKNKLFKELNTHEFQDQISTSVVSKCGSALGLYGLEGIQDFNELFKNAYLNTER